VCKARVGFLFDLNERAYILKGFKNHFLSVTKILLLIELSSFIFIKIYLVAKKH